MSVKKLIKQVLRASSETKCNNFIPSRSKMSQNITEISVIFANCEIFEGGVGGGCTLERPTWSVFNVPIQLDVKFN